MVMGGGRDHSLHPIESKGHRCIFVVVSHVDHNVIGPIS